MDFRQYFYLIGVSIFIPIWLLLFLKKERRKDMILIGILLGIGATAIEHLYAKLDYWNPIFLFPNFPFEDFLYGFVFGGISAELYEMIFKKRNSKKRLYPTHKRILLLFALVTAFSFWLLVDYLKLNSIIAHIVPPIFVGIFVAILRKDLFISELFNGLFVTFLTILMFKILLLIYPEIFINHWYLQNLSGLYFLKIPIEELLFAFAVGFGAGNVYEFVFGYSEIQEKIITKPRKYVKVRRTHN